MLATNSGLCKTIWLLSKRHVSRSPAPAHTSLSSQEATLWPVSSSSQLSHFLSICGWTNQLSHHWSERGLSKRRRSRTVLQGWGCGWDFTFFSPVYSAPTLHTDKLLERGPLLFLLLLSHALLSLTVTGKGWQGNPDGWPGHPSPWRPEILS